MTFSPLPRSDLACEITPEKDRIGTTEKNEYMLNGFRVTDTVISGEKDFPDGRFTTVDIGKIHLCTDSTADLCTDTLATLLREYLHTASGGKDTDSLCILAVGLGNRFITADRLGPRTADKLIVTNHLTGTGADIHGCPKICAISPGVIGQTGIETAYIIKGAVKAVHPDVVIAVDSLAARSTERLATTVQISDAGISPGSGTGDKRIAVNKETVGCPVISVGVPTVVDSATLIIDALETAGICDIPGSLVKVLKNGRWYLVSPKDCDIITEELSTVISSAICRAAGL